MQLCQLGWPVGAVGVTKCDGVCWGDQLKQSGWPNATVCARVTSWSCWGDQIRLCVLGWPVEAVGVTKCEYVCWGDQLKPLGWRKKAKIVLLPQGPVREWLDFLPLHLLRQSWGVNQWEKSIVPPPSPACAVTSQFCHPLRILAPHRLRFTNVRRCHHDLMQYKREACKILPSSWQILHIWIPGLGFREVVWFVYFVKWSFSQVVLNICMGRPFTL